MWRCPSIGCFYIQSVFRSWQPESSTKRCSSNIQLFSLISFTDDKNKRALTTERAEQWTRSHWNLFIHEATAAGIKHDVKLCVLSDWTRASVVPGLLVTKKAWRISCSCFYRFSCGKIQNTDMNICFCVEKLQTVNVFLLNGCRTCASNWRPMGQIWLLFPFYVTPMTMMMHYIGVQFNLVFCVSFTI